MGFVYQRNVWKANFGGYGVSDAFWTMSFKPRACVHGEFSTHPHTRRHVRDAGAKSAGRLILEKLADLLDS